jgi:hypothetical protein
LASFAPRQVLVQEGVQGEAQGLGEAHHVLGGEAPEVHGPPLDLGHEAGGEARQTGEAFLGEAQRLAALHQAGHAGG